MPFLLFLSLSFSSVSFSFIIILMKRILDYTITNEYKNYTIREFLTEKGYPKGLRAHLFRTKDVLFRNGDTGHSSDRLKVSDKLKIILEESMPKSYPAPENIPLSILYEDPYFLAVDKPAGMLVHPSPQKNSGTLANGVLYHLQQSAAGAGVHPVPRLDRDPFGVVLLAKNANVHDRFCRLLREKQLEKTYLASVFGHPPQDAGEIDLPVEKVGGGSSGKRPRRAPCWSCTP